MSTEFFVIILAIIAAVFFLQCRYESVVYNCEKAEKTQLLACVSDCRKEGAGTPANSCTEQCQGLFCKPLKYKDLKP